ncbi:PACE efflux transporter [Vibrio sp. SM6]|uniref:PACE efflux transporter n=1 Tax=Vibrio agarilyticus TaxID=2726741 RepID=A0A7X8YIA7_9VIBR|nr:PACE efflux transporter [Vibrio agarilyticus]NLS14514.1 PACE efflux transporter [Vibrio agarilyticus]
MKPIERVFHAVLFEALAITCSVIGLALFTDHQVSALSGTMIVVATIAMMWNYVFNWGFDRFVPGEKTERSIKTRIIHVLLFEAGLLFVTIPVMAILLNVSLWQAFLMDISVTIFITCYAFVYNFAYDHIRAYILRRRGVISLAADVETVG